MLASIDRAPRGRIGRKLAPVHPLAAAPSPVDWVARGIAFVSLLVSIASVAVTITLWRREGWQLELRVKCGQDDGTSKWAVEITNVGRQACEVARAGLIVRDCGGTFIGRTYATGLPVRVAPSATRTVDCGESDVRHCIKIAMQGNQSSLGLSSLS
jgi:hypothetical protein